MSQVRGDGGHSLRATGWVAGGVWASSFSFRHWIQLRDWVDTSCHCSHKDELSSSLRSWICGHLEPEVTFFNQFSLPQGLALQHPHPD